MTAIPISRFARTFAGVFALPLSLALIFLTTGCCQAPDPALGNADKPATQSNRDKSGFTPVTARALDGEPFAVSTTAHKATVLIFLLPDCPIANGYAPEIKRLHDEYSKKGIRLVLVYSDRDITAATAKAHRTDYGHTSDAVVDPHLSLALRTGATITPETAVLSPSGALLYRGRIDDRFPAYGKRRDKATKTELRDALDALLAGQPIAVARTEAVGCFLDLR